MEPLQRRPNQRTAPVDTVPDQPRSLGSIGNPQTLPNAHLTYIGPCRTANDAIHDDVDMYSTAEPGTLVPPPSWMQNTVKHTQ